MSGTSRLRRFPDSQVTVLADIVDAHKTGANRSIDTGTFRDASIPMVMSCGDATG
jgi:hypothetical protein